MNMEDRDNQKLVFLGLVICGLWAAVFAAYLV